MEIFLKSELEPWGLYKYMQNYYAWIRHEGTRAGSSPVTVTHMLAHEYKCDVIGRTGRDSLILD
jgi:hypothetical protein